MFTTMKKTYIIPEVTTVQIATEMLIAESVERGQNTISNSNDILVKENKTTDYDVWSDDWSK